MPDAAIERRPPREQIAAYYARMIEEGRLAPGDQLPSIRDMAAQHGVAPGTAAEAVKLLVAWQLVTTQRGRHGTTVSEPAGEVKRARKVCCSVSLEQAAQLDQIAADRGVGQQDVVREAITEFLSKHADDHRG